MATFGKKRQQKLSKLREQQRAGELGKGGQKRLKKLKSFRKDPSQIPQAGEEVIPQAGPGTPYGTPKAGAKGLATSVANIANENLDAATDQAFKPFDFNALPAAPVTQDLAGERARIEQTIGERLTRGFADDKEQERQALEQRLAERGIAPGSGELYKNEMDRFQQRWDDRYDDARSRAVEMGGTEFERSFGIGRLGRSDAIGEQVLGRQLPMEQLQSLMSIWQSPAQLAKGYQDYQQQLKLQRIGHKQAKDLASHQASLQPAIPGGGGGDAVPPPPLRPPEGL